MRIQAPGSLMARTIAAAVLLIAAAPTEGRAASARAASGRWFVKAADAGSSSVWFGTFSWASTANINWTVPTFTADGAARPTAPVPFSEPKFTIVAGFPAARVWTGYNITGVGALGSTVTSVGSGSSNVGVVFYGANWNVTANGAGTYDVVARAVDPYNIFPSDLESITDPTYSVYVPFSLLDGSSDTSGSTLTSGFGAESTYTTADGTESLLNIVISGTDATVTATSAFGSSLLYYLQADSTTAPVGSGIPGALITLAEIEALLESNLSSGGVLTAPLNLGIVLSGIPVPTVLLSDGSVAQVGASAVAFESNVIPEPSSLALAGIGVLLLPIARRAARRRPAPRT